MVKYIKNDTSFLCRTLIANKQSHEDIRQQPNRAMHDCSRGRKNPESM